ncbi:helix-turn-helix domain-containing protein [Methylobacterium sp. WL8]|uniref:helix-turn-helix domain-containing protein n=1 Tax=Methylobacterium sp. WL8 TaxID=2603899 RepID=UPI0032B1A4D4
MPSRPARALRPHRANLRDPLAADGSKDIADHPGLTIKTVSRLLTRLDRKRSLPIVPGGVRLLDLDRLVDPAA